MKPTKAQIELAAEAGQDAAHKINPRVKFRWCNMSRVLRLDVMSSVAAMFAVTETEAWRTAGRVAKKRSRK